MNKIVKNYYYFNAASVVERLISFVLIAILARYLGTKGFGVYSLAFALSELYSFLFEFGLSRLLTKKISNRSSDNEAQDLSSALALQAVTAVIGFGALVVTTELLNYPQETRSIIYLISLSVMLTYFAATIRAVFVGKGNAKIDAFLSVLVKCVVFGGIMVSVFLRRGLPSIASVFICAGALNVLLSAYLLRKNYFSVRFNFDVEKLKARIREALPFTSLVVFSVIYLQIDSVMISKFVGTAAVGIYSAAYKLVLVTFFISTNIVMATYPAIGEALTASKEKAVPIFTKTVKYLLVFAVPIGTGATVLSKELIGLIYGPGYEAAAPALSIIIWWVPLIYLTQFMGGVLTLQNREKTVAVIAGVGAALNVAGNFLFIPLYGIEGAASMKLVTEGVILLLQAILLYKMFLVHFNKTMIIKVAVSSAVMGVFIYYFKEFFSSVPLIVLAGATVYFMTILAMHLVGIDELKAVLMLRSTESRG